MNEELDCENPGRGRGKGCEKLEYEKLISTMYSKVGVGKTDENKQKVGSMKNK